MLERRRECETLGYWDQQYGLQAKPARESRLDPARIPLYDVEPRFERANKVLQCWLGKARIVGAALRWDPSSGKLRSDTSALALVLQDENGCRYWHRTVALTGEVAEFDAAGREIIGGQVMGICDIVQQFGVRRITVETNGIGKFAPTVLRAALKQRGIGACGVKEIDSSAQKNKRILEAFEPLMLSRMLWAHVSVSQGQAFVEMREWNPAVTNQPDDHLDAGAGAITDQPERLSDSFRNRNADDREDWRPGHGVFEAELEL